jgi:hypothetical protein
MSLIQVRAIEAALLAPAGGGGAGRPDLAAMLRTVQNAEAEKLRWAGKKGLLPPPWDFSRDLL